jgi:transmembrane sensor
MRTRRKFNDIETTATTWLVRQDAGLSARERAEFARWCSADPRHAAAVKEISGAWASLDRVTPGHGAQALRHEIDVLADRQRRRWWRLAAVAVPLATAAAVALLFWPRQASVDPNAGPTLATPSTVARLLEPERRKLSDGSVIELKSGAEVDILFSDLHRRVVLRHGEAHFQVAHDPARPFVVLAGTVRVSAVGTGFAVQMNEAHVEVVVTEGTVRVTPPESGSPGAGRPEREEAPARPIPAPAPAVHAGTRVLVALDGRQREPAISSLPSTELTARLAWRLPRLEFSDATVAEAVTLFNRHGSIRLRLADETAANQRITGVFRADNVEGFVRALEVGVGLRAERRFLEVVLRSAD